MFLLSLGMPAFHTSYPAELSENPGGLVLIYGWLGVLGAQVAWFANPLFLVSFFMKSTKSSANLAFVALALALSFLINPLVPSGLGDLVKSAKAFGLGYALWVSAIAVMVIGQYRMSQGAGKVAAVKPALATAAGILTLYVVYFFLSPITTPLAKDILGL